MERKGRWSPSLIARQQTKKDGSCIHGAADRRVQLPWGCIAFPFCRVHPLLEGPTAPMVEEGGGNYKVRMRGQH